MDNGGGPCGSTSAHNAETPFQPGLHSGTMLPKLPLQKHSTVLPTLVLPRLPRACAFHKSRIHHLGQGKHNRVSEILSGVKNIKLNKAASQLSQILFTISLLQLRNLSLLKVHLRSILSQASNLPCFISQAVICRGKCTGIPSGTLIHVPRTFCFIQSSYPRQKIKNSCQC